MDKILPKVPDEVIDELVQRGAGHYFGMDIWTNMNADLLIVSDDLESFEFLEIGSGSISTRYRNSFIVSLVERYKKYVTKIGRDLVISFIEGVKFSRTGKILLQESMFELETYISVALNLSIGDKEFTIGDKSHYLLTVDGKHTFNKMFLEPYHDIYLDKSSFYNLLMRPEISNGVFDILLKEYRRRFNISSDEAITISLERELKK